MLREDALPMQPWNGADALEPGALPTELMLQKEQRVAVAAALRACGHSPRQIAAQLRVSPTTVRLYLQQARQWGALDDVMRDIEHRAVPTAVENLLRGLEEGDKDYTLETLKGRGLLRSFTNQKQEGGSAPAMNLAVTFINAPAQPVTGAFVDNTLHGQVLGKPRE